MMMSQFIQMNLKTEYGNNGITNINFFGSQKQ